MTPPTIWAAINGYLDIINLLLKEAALVDVRDNKGLMPLMRAAWSGHEKVVAALVDGGADIHAADDRGVTAMQRAASVSEHRIMELLRMGPKIRPQEIIVLLMGEDGNVGTLNFLDQRASGRKLVLNKANKMLTRDREGKSTTSIASKAFLEQEFGRLLEALPKRPATTVKKLRTRVRQDSLLYRILALLYEIWPLLAGVAVVGLCILFVAVRLRRR